MVHPEQLQHLSVARLLRIEMDLDRLRVVTTEGELVAKTVGKCTAYTLLRSGMHTCVAMVQHKNWSSELEHKLSSFTH